MKIYYYHTRPIEEALKEWEKHLHPGHILYGLTHFNKYGITPILHPFRRFSSRLKLSFYNFFEIIRCKETYDLLYGTSFYGLELIIFCRALGLFRKPIAIWHHQAVVRNPNPIKNIISRFYYKGIDQMFFFSRTLINDSLQSGKVTADRLHLIHWGADIDFYDYLRQHLPATGSGKQEKAFITTGKEHRDFATLLKAFAETGPAEQGEDQYACGNLHHSGSGISNPAESIQGIFQYTGTFHGGYSPPHASHGSLPFKIRSNLLPRLSLHRRTDHSGRGFCVRPPRSLHP